ncbi:MAG: cadherin domain-containing protein, partial [Pseudomonadota bacterium]
AENSSINLSTTLEISDDLSINGDVDGDGDADVTLDGLGTSRIFTLGPDFSVQSISVSLNGLDLENGAEPLGTAIAGNSGGAISSVDTNLSISNTSFSNNVSLSSGGALFLIEGSTLIENSVFSGNSSPEILNVSGVLQIAATSPASVTVDGTPATFGPSSIPYITSSNGGAGATATFTVAENTTFIADFNAVDSESSEGNGLTYSTSGSSLFPFDEDEFFVDPTTGVLRFRSGIDFENPGDENGDNVYEIRVNVTDASGNTDFQDIAVIVTNADEAPPKISGGSPALEAMPENAPLEAVIADIDAFDDISAEGNGLTYSITGGADGDLFTVDAATGIVRFAVAVDFENPADADLDNIYKVQITVTDATGKTDALDLDVLVTDFEELPVITSNGGGATAAISVLENTTLVTDVQATDDISAEGSGLTYSITGGADQSLFTIDAATGVMSFLSAPDFETPADANGNNVYDVQITAADAAGLTDVQDIAVTVADIDDQAPVVFNETRIAIDGFVELPSAENETFVFDFNSTDNVSSEGSGLEYSISAPFPNNDLDLFEIDASTGVLSFLAPPDFEAPVDFDQNNRYLLAVSVKDAAGNETTQFVSPVVTDIDDQAPTIFAIPPVATNLGVLINVAENETFVFDFNSTDNVSSEGSGLTYSISSSSQFPTAFNEDAFFGIDASTGVLSFSTPPDFEAPSDFDSDNNYLFDVSVTDAAGNISTTGLVVRVTDAEETPPPAAGPSDFLTFSLVDTGTDQVITTLTNGAVIDPQLVAGRNVSVVAEHIDDANPVGSVELTLGSQTRVEDVEPYALFGDDMQGDFFTGTMLSAGPQQLNVRVFSEDQGAGTELEAFDFEFTVGDRTRGDELQISNFFEFVLVDTDTDTIITQILDGSIIDATAVEDRNVSVIATQLAGTDPVGSARLTLGGQSRTENVEPFALFGDDGHGDFFGGTTLETGAQELGVKAFSEDNAEGTTLEDLILQFFIEDDFAMA